MNKFKALVCTIVIFCTMSTISYAKQVVKVSDTQDGTKENPFVLTMGEGIIDVYYAKEDAKEQDKESYKDFYFKFAKGNLKIKSGNYMVEHNADKHRVRFTLMGTTEDDLKVASSSGLNYFQAGAKTIVQNQSNLKESNVENETFDTVNDLKEELQAPYYTINATETISVQLFGSVQHKYAMANGFIRVDNVLGANVSTYSTSYIFAVSDESFKDIYTITKEQIDKKAKIYLYGYERCRFVSENKLESTIDEMQFSIKENEPVEILYCFNTTRSEVGNAEEEEAPLVERIISKVFLAFGDAMVSLTKIGKYDSSSESGISMFVTLDSLVFNEYPKTIVDLWEDIGTTNIYAQKVVRFWFNAFKAWAIAVYVLLLIYVGIKTVLSTGTPEQKKVRPMIEGWLTGLLMLFFLPFLFKYVIKINDAIVDIVRTNSKYSVYAYYTFEDQYKSMGGKQDGEDSMTSIVDRLTNAKVDLEKQVEELGNLSDAFDDAYDEARNKLEESQQNEEKIIEKIEVRLKNLRDLYKGPSDTEYDFRKDGVYITIDEIYTELEEMVADYFKDKSYFNEDTGKFDSSIEGELKEKVNEYAEKFIVYDKKEGKEATRKNDGNQMDQKDGKWWYTYYLQQTIKNTVFRSSDSSGEGTVVEKYREEAWIKYYESERNKYLEEQAKKQEQIYGIEKAIERAEESDADITGMMRNKAGKTSKFVYVLVWLMLIFQVVLLLILYYKRLFMIAVLVSVFPLVMIAYVYEKTQGTKGSVFKNWIQEYLINVFIQSIHAILYVTIVELGYTIFLADGDNWLMFFIATWAMISSEPIFKNLIGLNGKATLTGLGDYAKSADTIAFGALTATAGILKSYKDIAALDDRNRNKEAEIEKKNAKKDARTSTKRKEEENRIKKKYGENSEEGKRRLEEKKKREEKQDQKKAKKRKKAIKRRRRLTRARMIARVCANIGQVGIAATSALATGDGGTFNSTNTGMSALRKLDSKGLTDDAKAREKRIEEEQMKEEEAKNQADNVNAESKLKDVKTQEANDGNSSTGQSNVADGNVQPQSGVDTGNNAKTTNKGNCEESINKFREALIKQKAYTDQKWQNSENWSINDEDEK